MTMIVTMRMVFVEVDADGYVDVDGDVTHVSESVAVTVTLGDVNDEPPTIAEESYTLAVAETITAKTIGPTVQFTDGDSTATYREATFTIECDDEHAD